MGKIGYGYGSECHLLRWMGRHRSLFDSKVSDAVGRPGVTIEWLDFDFAPNKRWPDAELKGLEFLYEERPTLKCRWQRFWPTGRGIHNWDAVGWIGSGPYRELLFLEAKSHIGEIKSDCGAKSPGSIRKITEAFYKTKEALGANPDADWMRSYYQAANRIATLYFLQQEGIPARLLLLYFLSDRHDGQECPRTEQQWEQAIEAQWAHLGLDSEHHLSGMIHKLFLPIALGPN